MDSSLEELRKRIEGKTILKVEEPNSPEAICKLTLSDGTAFRLHANDLGFWIEDTINSNCKYTSFTSMFNDIHHHECILDRQYNYDTPRPTVVIDSNILKITTVDGRVFIADISLLPKWERKVCKHKKSIELISGACTLGNFWKMEFSRNENCPKELKLEE